MRFNVLVLLMILGIMPACKTIKHPSSNPTKMSSDTLCYRNDTKSTQAMRDEIRARGLNCRTILQDDPLLNHGRRY